MSDLQSILNIPNGGIDIEDIKVSLNDTSELDQLFRHHPRIRRWDIERKLKEICEGNFIVNDDVIVKLWIAHRLLCQILL